MQETTLPSSANLTSSAGVHTDNDTETEEFYIRVLEELTAANIPFLVGGAYAFYCYTGISRNTKDLDIFIRWKDFQRLSESLEKVGYITELTYPHWLGKIHHNGAFIDVIFNSGNGIVEVDDAWFDHALPAEVFGKQVKICPIEETIWSKAFIMERERFDGADIVHLIRSSSDKINWQRLIQRFDEHWRVLFSHLILFGFVYACSRDLIPAWVMDELIARLKHETHSPPPRDKVCAGPLLSREQYLMDIQRWGYQDARLMPLGNMTPGETASWTDAIGSKH